MAGQKIFLPRDHHAHHEINAQRQHKRGRAQGEEKQVAPAGADQQERHAVGGQRLEDREADSRPAPSAFLGGGLVLQQFVDASQHERNDPGRECANDDARDDQPKRTGGKRR